MATAKKVNKSAQVRAYQAKNPDASAIKVAKACNTNPAYVYAIRASDKGKAAKTQKWKITDIVTSNESIERRHPVTGKILMQGLPMKEDKTEADRIFELAKGRDRAGVTKEMLQDLVTDLQAERVEDHPLYAVFMDAIKQAMHGKGERHGGARTPFLEQPWAHYTKMHGRGFATGQATKKLEEAASTRTGEAFEQEVFGAIVYAGMAILKERGQV